MERDFDVGVCAAKIKQGVTTQSKHCSWLGEHCCVSVSLASDGERFDAWGFYFAEGEMADMNSANVNFELITGRRLYAQNCAYSSCSA